MSAGDLKIIDKSQQGEKADLQTEADRAAQYCIVHSLAAKFGNALTVIGEEVSHERFALSDASEERQDL